MRVFGAEPEFTNHEKFVVRNSRITEKKVENIYNTKSKPKRMLV